MNISSQIKSGVLLINVLGHLDKLIDQQQLIELLQNKQQYASIVVNFYDAMMLPNTVISQMAELADLDLRFKINVFHSCLAHMLIQLGFKVIYKAHEAPSYPVTLVPKAIVIGGSAESLDKIIDIIDALPFANIVIFIIQHVSDAYPSSLDKLLKHRTDYAVVLPQNLLPLEPGTIYIAPPGYQMKVGQGQVYLTQDREINFARPSIDVLFKSVAYEFGSLAMGVILCGFGKDGVEGAKLLQQQGGIVLLEDSIECHHATPLIEAVKKAKCYDYLFGIKQICCHISSLISTQQELSEQMIDSFLLALQAVYAYDFTGYQHGTIRRRIENLINRLNFSNFFDFQRNVLADPIMFERFFVEISINVTSFFRYPEQFRVLREDILPYLDAFPYIKIWSAGCSSGEEAYSLAILLDEMGMLGKTQIFATDINSFVLQQARTRLYPLASLKTNRENYLNAGGIRQFDDYVENNGRYLSVHERLQEKVLFHHHSLVQDGIFNEFQLILCRNVLIYFRADKQLDIATKFYHSLHSDGFLIIGGNEGVTIADNGRFFSSYDKGKHIYRPI